MGIIRFAVTLILVVVLGCTSLLAGGFENTGLGVRARAMGGAFRAIADDWSAAWYNPAGYAFIPDNQVGGNSSFMYYRDQIEPNYSFGGPADSTGIYNGRPIYNAHQVLSMPSGGFLVRLPVWGETVFGLSAYEPFDANIRWSLYSPLRSYNDSASYKPPSEQFTNNLDVVAFQLTMAREFMDQKLAVGLGLQLQRGDLVFKNLTFRENPMPSPLSDRPRDKVSEISYQDGDGWGFGLKGGVLLKQSEKLHLAASFNIPFDITLKGKATQTFIMPKIFPVTGVNLNSVEYLFVNGATIQLNSDFETKLRLPMTIGVGASYAVNEKLTLAIDAQMTMWSRFKGFDFTYTSFGTFRAAMDSATAKNFFTANLSSPVDWKDAGRLAIGAIYNYNSYLTLLGGISADQSPARDSKDFIPQFIDTGNKYGFNFGAIVHIQRWDLGLATSIIRCPDLTVTDLVDSNGDGNFDSFPGKYSGNTYETILSFNYRY